MTVLDLFSGIGGFRTGLERSGHKCIGHVEIDKYAHRSYMAIYGLVPCKHPNGYWDNGGRICPKAMCESCEDIDSCKGEWYANDITAIAAGEIPRAEIWSFGFPCVDISISGRQAGLRGSRSGLFFTVIGLLEGTVPEDRPQWLLIENVKHLVTSERGWAFTTVLSELWRVGYDCEWQVVNSKNFSVPQHRERVYIVGHLRGRGGRKVLPVSGTDGAALKQIISGRQGERAYNPEGGVSVALTAEAGGFAGHTGLYAVSCHRKDGITARLDTAHTLTASDYRGLNRNQSQTAVLVNEKAAPGIIRCGNVNPSANGMNGNVFDAQGLSPTLTTNKGEGLKIAIPPTNNQPQIEIKEATQAGYAIAGIGDSINISFPDSKTRRGRVGSKIAKTLVTNCNQGVFDGYRLRKLTPKECFRLQGFGDDQHERAASVCSDTQLYRQTGNAVTTTIVYEIGKRLME